MMNALDEQKLKEILHAAGGADEDSVPQGDFLDTPFAELGYDSLAVMETGARIEREFGVTPPEESITVEATPRALIDAVNKHLVVA